VLSPGVYVSPGAVVRESVLMKDTWVGPGAVVDHCIVDKHAVVGAGTYLGWGDDFHTPNFNNPDQFSSGINVVGENAHIPSKLRIGRNVVIRLGLDEGAFDRFDGLVPSGETVG